MQTETQATESATDTAQTADTTAAATEAQASAAEATANSADTSTNTDTAADENGKPQEEQPRDDKGQFKSSVQKRIDDLTFRRNQAEREAAHWKSVAEARQQADIPRPGDFNSDADYEAALLEHRIEDGVNRGLAKTAEAQADKFSREAQSAVAEAYNHRVQEAKVRIPDFAEVVGKADVAISKALHEALVESEKGPDLAYFLAKNPAEAERLNSMSVRQMDREIGRLEQNLGAKAAPAAPAARTTKAPPPVSPGSPAGAPANTDPAKMNNQQYQAWMKANGSKYV